VKPNPMLCWKCQAVRPVADGLCGHCLEDSERARNNLPQLHPPDVCETVLIPVKNPQTIHAIDFS
jgi:predicted amidophosphoribosyltransferase